LIIRGLNELRMHSHSTWPQYVVVHRALKQSYHYFWCCAWFAIILSWIRPLWFRALQL